MKHEISSYNTRKAFAEALKDAMRKKPFKKITVTELIEACDVNRKTFYYHFEDVYGLLKWMLEEEAIQVVKHFDFTVDYKVAINFVMDYVEENEQIINCIYDSIGRDELKRFFYKDFYEIGANIIDVMEKKTGVNLDSDYKLFLNQFYVEAIVGMLVEWIKDREKYNRETVINYILFTINNSLTGIMENSKMLKDN